MRVIRVAARVLHFSIFPDSRGAEPLSHGRAPAFILCRAARNVITAANEMQRAVTLFQEASTESRAVIEKHRGIFPAKPRSRCLLHFFASFSFSLSTPFRSPLFLLFFFCFSTCRLAFVLRPVIASPLCPAIKGFTRTNRPCSHSRIRPKLNFFLCLLLLPLRGRGPWGGMKSNVLCLWFSFSLSVALSIFGWKVDRIPEEIEWKSRRARRCNSEVT